MKKYFLTILSCLSLLLTYNSVFANGNNAEQTESSTHQVQYLPQQNQNLQQQNQNLQQQNQNLPEFKFTPEEIATLKEYIIDSRADSIINSIEEVFKEEFKNGKNHKLRIIKSYRVPYKMKNLENKYLIYISADKVNDEIKTKIEVEMLEPEQTIDIKFERNKLNFNDNFNYLLENEVGLNKNQIEITKKFMRSNFENGLKLNIESKNDLKKFLNENKIVVKNLKEQIFKNLKQAIKDNKKVEFVCKIEGNSKKLLNITSENVPEKIDSKTSFNFKVIKLN